MAREITLIEVGLRDGLQSEKTVVATEQKVAWLRALLRAGIGAVQAVSFVHPKRVPQMADTEALLSSLTTEERAACSGLVLNMRGLERAIDAGLSQVDLSLSTSDTHSRKNTGMGLDEAMTVMQSMLARAREAGLAPRVGLQNVFGCRDEGHPPLSRLIEMSKRVVGEGASMLSLADSSGMAVPDQIKRVAGQLKDAVPGVPVLLHLHDTRGLAMSNMLAALDIGVTHFDTAVGGTGGCPFIENAAGNLATEDVVALCDTSGWRTGIDKKALAVVAREIEAALGHPLSGRYYRLEGAGVPPHFFGAPDAAHLGRASADAQTAAPTPARNASPGVAG